MTEDQKWDGTERLLILEAVALGFILGNPKARMLLFDNCPTYKWFGPLRQLAKAIERGDKKDAAHLLGIKRASFDDIVAALTCEHRRIMQNFLPENLENLAGLFTVSGGMYSSKQLDERLKDLDLIKQRIQECRDDARAAEALEQPAACAS